MKTVSGSLLLGLAVTIVGTAVASEGAAADARMAHEIALAESAAPPEVAREADIYVLGADGYMRVRAGSNGFACIVERSHPRSTEPICFDSEGVRTILPMTIDRAAMRAAGKDEEAIAAAMAEGFRSGRYRAPARTGVAYMLSPATRFYDAQSDRLIPVPPHLMFYAPYLTDADIGSPGERAREGTALPFVIDAGGPHAYIVVFVNSPAGSVSAL